MEEPAWDIQAALDYYGVERWGSGHFTINGSGNMVARSSAGDVDLDKLVGELRAQGIASPVLVRLADVLTDRVRRLNDSFAQAIDDAGYRGGYRGVFPIKVNQQREVVEGLLRAGARDGLGLEVGSKPELLAAVALCGPRSLIICNGFKDEEYVEMALLAQRLEHDVVVVLDRPGELDLVIAVAHRLGVEPRIGVRCKLSSRGSGRWQDSGGSGAKFGLSAAEVIEVVDRLAEMDWLTHLALLHFHIGSQITDIGALKPALQEASRVYVELRGLGGGLEYIDIGGGLAVDYTGARTRSSEGSRNYTTAEYARDAVHSIGQVCDQYGQPHPTIVSESGRALVAHHAVLIVEVLDANLRLHDVDEGALREADPPTIITQLLDVRSALSAATVRESLHDAVHLERECREQFRHGLIDLRLRGAAERLIGDILARLLELGRDRLEATAELLTLERAFADLYYCNFSLFRSLPDSWAVDHVFPIVPIHRLAEEPTHRATLADITCDSDGKIDRFHTRELSRTLRVHALDGAPYLLGVFLVGAYQESLGGLHNLFGDTNAVMVSIGADGACVVDEVVQGEDVSDVLGYVHYAAPDLLRRLGERLGVAVSEQRLTPEQSRAFVRTYEAGLRGYTYLERDHVSHSEGD